MSVIEPDVEQVEFDSKSRDRAHEHSHSHAHSGSHRERRSLEAQSLPSGLYVPLLLLGIAVALGLILQSVQLFQQRSAVQTVEASQREQVKVAKDLRTALDALASNTQALADSGNTGAKQLVEALRKRGVTIHAPAKASAAGLSAATPSQ